MMVQEEQRPRFEEAPARVPTPSTPATLEDRAVPRAAEEANRTDAEQRRAVKPPAPASSAPVPTERQRAAGDAAIAPPPQVESLGRREQRLEESPGARAPASPMMAPAPAEKALAAPPAAASGAASDSLSRERAVGERPAREMRSAPQVARSPEDWIEEIRRLKSQGRDADAAAELAEFRRRHPDYALPADLAR